MNAKAVNAHMGIHVLRCVHCGVVQRRTGNLFRCSKCSELLEVIYPDWGTLDAQAAQRLKQVWRDRRLSLALQDSSGVWRYRELLPGIERQHIVTMGEGNTPLVPLKQSARALGFHHLLAKHLGMNPTGSFKDSGMAVAISVAKAEGFSWVCCASTGNTSASVAAYAAHAGMKSVVLLPAGQVSAGKLAQALEYGAIVLQLQTDFDGCLKILQEVVQRFSAYLLNSVNPYRVEGQKTVAFELAEQMDWNVPEHVILPGGNLGNCSALGKGFLELHKLGLISQVPRISVIQAEGANPLVRTMRKNGGRELVRVNAETRATAIRIGNPASWRKAVAVLKSTGGTCEEVSEEEIAMAKSELGAEGIACEPASAASLAGLKKLMRSGFVKPKDSTVLILTGHMLKDTDYMLKAHGEPFSTLDANAEAVIKRLEQLHAGN
ncbi:MAG TPA: threonine synthase [Candidatus Angelobacter sp.]